jgi:hypothetical protein
MSGWAKADPDNLRHHRRQRARRHHHQRHLRAALQLQRRRPVGPEGPPAEAGRGPDPDRLRRPGPGPLSNVQGNPALSTAVATWKAATPEQRTKWATAYTDAIGTAAADGEPATGAGGEVAKAKPGDYGPVPALSAGLPRPGQDRRPRRRPDLLRQLLRRRPDPVPAAALRRRLPRRPRRRPEPRRRPVGNDERGRQRPRPALDVALHLLVPGQTLLHLRQRRRRSLGPDDAPDPAA